MRRVVDFHTHAYPDALAARAMPRLEAAAHVSAALDGTVRSLLGSMDAAGIDTAVVASVATRPEQYDAILGWSAAIASPRLVPFPSVHPADPKALPRIREIAARGFRGIKLHPYYQEFILDEERMAPLYAEIQRCGLLLLCHTGFDLACERRRIADPARIAAVIERFPRLRFVATHLGAWEDWEDVERLLIGRQVTMDVAYVYGHLEPERMRRLLMAHPADRLLFGTDSPWADQAGELAKLLSLDLPPERLEAILGRNADRLLG